MHLAGRYLKSRLGAALVFLLFSGVFIAVFALYRLPAGAAVYPALMCAVLGLIFIVLDYLRFLRRHRTLERLLQSVQNAADALPEAESPLEADYQALIRGLHTENLHLDGETRRRADAQTQYYTAWAHQIKTPIAAMRLLLQGADAPDKAALALELQRVEQYVEMVLCYARLDSESTDYVIRRTPLDDILKPVIRSCAPQFIHGRISLDYRPIAEAVLTDEKWLGFVAGQLLQNALKYTRPGGRISISLEPERVLLISDTGIGIPESDLPRVTECGFTGENGRSDRRATGIGLYLCGRILRNLGHGMQITSRVGEGTQVRIDLKSSRLETE